MKEIKLSDHFTYSKLLFFALPTIGMIMISIKIGNHLIEYTFFNHGNTGIWVSLNFTSPKPDYSPSHV